MTLSAVSEPAAPPDLQPESEGHIRVSGSYRTVPVRRPRLDSYSARAPGQCVPGKAEALELDSELQACSVTVTQTVTALRVR